MNAQMIPQIIPGEGVVLAEDSTSEEVLLTYITATLAELTIAFGPPSQLAKCNPERPSPIRWRLSSTRFGLPDPNAQGQPHPREVTLTSNGMPAPDPDVLFGFGLYGAPEAEIDVTATVLAVQEALAV